MSSRRRQSTIGGHIDTEEASTSANGDAGTANQNIPTKSHSNQDLGEGINFSIGLTSMVANDLLKQYGKNELPEKKTPKWFIFMNILSEPMPMMIWLAIIIEGVLTKWMDMFVLLGIQLANASIAFYETTKAGDAVAALKNQLKPEATVYRDGTWKKIDSSYIVPGDMVLLAGGSSVPADCIVNDGCIDVDQAQLTGEALPVSMFRGDRCKLGSTVVRGEVAGTVEFTGQDTFFGKTVSMLQGAEEPSNLQVSLDLGLGS